METMQKVSKPFRTHSARLTPLIVLQMNNPALATQIHSHTQSQHAPDPVEDTNPSDKPEDTKCCALQEALSFSNDILGLNNHAKAQLDEYSYAAVCMNFTDQEKM